MEELYVNCDLFSPKQKVLYKPLLNACFHCGTTGHVNKDYPYSMSTLVYHLDKERRNMITNCTTRREMPVIKEINIKPQPMKLKQGMERRIQNFTPSPKKRTFKQKKNQGIKMKPNFYAQLEKYDILNERDDLLDITLKTQFIKTFLLDGWKLIRGSTNSWGGWDFPRSCAWLNTWRQWDTKAWCQDEKSKWTQKNS